VSGDRGGVKRGDVGEDGDKTGFLICLVTASGVEEARSIADAVVSEGLAACCNVVPAIESIYRWKGKVCHESEALCIFKTREDIFVKFSERVVEMHSYEIPEVAALEITAGETKYLKWLDDACGAGHKKMF